MVRRFEFAHPGGIEHGGRPLPVNARCETIATNGLFGRLTPHVPVDGYFERHKLDASKQPCAIAMKSDGHLAMARQLEEYADKTTGKLVRVASVLASGSRVPRSAGRWGRRLRIARCPDPGRT